MRFHLQGLRKDLETSLYKARKDPFQSQSKCGTYTLFYIPNLKLALPSLGPAHQVIKA